MSKEGQDVEGGGIGPISHPGSSAGGVLGTEHGQAGMTPGGDAGSGAGGDVEVDNQLRDQGLDEQGIAGRAAREGTGEDDPENPSRVAGTNDPITPGYTP